MPARPLTACEREEIRAGIERGDTDGEIAGRLGRHRTTINAEINRYGGRSRYRATAAQRRADRERARPKLSKFELDPVLAAHVEARLVAKDSPMTISRELAWGVHGVTASVSHECIYQAVYAHGTRGLRRGLHEGLHRRRRCRKKRVPRGAVPATTGPLGEFNLIGLRPAIALRAHRGRPPRRRPESRRVQPLGDRHGVRPGQPPRVARRLPRRPRRG